MMFMMFFLKYVEDNDVIDINVNVDVERYD